MKFAIQLYSIRDVIHSGDDMLKALETVKAIGFDGVEFAGFYGLSADTLKEKLDALGLECVGAHMGRDDFLPERLNATLDFMETLGARCVGVGGAPTGTEEELTETVRILGSADKEAQKRGMRVYFHNHTGEFSAPEGAKSDETVFDRLKAQMAMELDTYWSFCAGQDNAALIRENKDCLIHLHLKDGLGGRPKALGEGDNDLKAVVDAAKAIGLDWLILENDDPVPNGPADAERSYRWLDANAR